MHAVNTESSQFNRGSNNGSNNGNTNTHTNTNTNAYKAAYNRHRRRPLDPNYIDDLNDLVDFSALGSHDARIVLRNDPTNNAKPNNTKTADKYTYEGPLLGLVSHPGFVYIPQALSKNVQNDLAYQALTEFCSPPHVTNIDLVPIKKGEALNRDDESMWALWKKEHFHHVDAQMVENSTQKPRMENSKNKTKEQLRAYKSFDKLSFATTGYHYDWTARAYVEECQSPMPKVMDRLGCIFAQLDERDEHEAFTASASIVNYYTTKSNMGGHRDDLELDFTRPVVSISLGLPAVFLLGGKTKDDDNVVPILVRPGDVMLLAGESRLCYHGMARVIPMDVSLPSPRQSIGGADTSEFQIQSLNEIGNDDCTSNLEKALIMPKSDLEAVETFLSRHRININVRQVLPHGVTTIPKARCSVSTG